MALGSELQSALLRFYPDVSAEDEALSGAFMQGLSGFYNLSKGLIKAF